MSTSSRSFIAMACLMLGLASCEQSEHGGFIVDCLPSGPPPCDHPCDDACGCAACYETQERCESGVIRRCKTNCIEAVETCPAPDACIGSKCAKSVADCDAVRAAYENELARSSSMVTVVRSGSSGLVPGEYAAGCPSDCAVVPGDCEAGLETCWWVGARTAEIDRLAGLYRRLGCAPPQSCDCPAPETALVCTSVHDAGGNYLRNACVKSQP